MTIVGCDDNSTDDNGGTFVLTDIPAVYNGKYVYLEAKNTSVSLIGCKSVNFSTETMTLAQISNGKVNIPMWVVNESNHSVSRYSGNDIFTQDNKFGVAIFNTATLTNESERIAGIYFTGSIVFANGSAEKSVKTGTVEEE